MNGSAGYFRLGLFEMTGRLGKQSQGGNNRVLLIECKASGQIFHPAAAYIHDLLDQLPAFIGQLDVLDAPVEPVFVPVYQAELDKAVDHLAASSIGDTQLSADVGNSRGVVVIQAHQRAELRHG